jgi:hypothetical protein
MDSEIKQMCQQKITTVMLGCGDDLRNRDSQTGANQIQR